MSHRRNDFDITHAELDGRPIVRKTAHRVEALEAIRYEREVLARIDHPGVVQLVPTDDDCNIVTTLAGSTTLADLSSLDLEQLTRITAHVALTLAELHRHGWAHGAVQPDHLIVGTAGRVTLCSLRRASRISGVQASAARWDAAALADTVEWSLDRVERSDGDSSLLSRLEACVASLRSDGAAALQRVGDMNVHTSRASPATRLPSRHLPRPAQIANTTVAARPVRGDRAEVRTSLATAGVCAVALVALRFLGPMGPAPHSPWTPIRIALVSVWATAALIALAGLLVHLLIALALWRDSVRLAELVERVAPPRLRQALAVVAAAGVTISSIGAVAAQRPESVSATVRDLASSPTKAATVSPTTLAPTTSVATSSTTSIVAAVAVAEQIAEPVQPSSLAAAPAAAITAPRSDYQVTEGDHLWGIAAKAVALALGRAPSDDEIDPYWRSLIELNRDRLIDSTNPDLIGVGQVFELPPIPK